MNDIYNLAGIGNFLIGILLLIGGYLAIRSGKHQKAGEIQDRASDAQDKAINALKAEHETTQRRLDVLERENTRLNMTINLIKRAINQKGFTITIDGDMVEIRDQRNGQTSSYSHIQETTPPQKQRRASQPAPASQWARKPWLEGETTELPTNNERTE